MKIIKGIFYTLLVIVLSSCSNGATANAINDMFIIDEPSSQVEMHTDSDQQEKSLQENYVVSDNICETYFVTIKRINPNMPEFTFTLIVGADLDESLRHYAIIPCENQPGLVLSPYYYIPSLAELTIIVEDNDGTVIQVISGLSLSRDFICLASYGLTFDDYNFDGYLDMRLLRWQNGAGGLLAHEYFWLWDTEKAQFVINAQLIKIGYSAGTHTNPETKQIVVRQRAGALSNLYYYEYNNGLLELVAYNYQTQMRDECTGFLYLVFTHTNLVTGEITVIKDPW